VQKEISFGLSGIGFEVSNLLSNEISNEISSLKETRDTLFYSMLDWFKKKTDFLFCYLNT
jgi:DNA gyrase/topoisomerase IV subunit B